MNNLKNIFIRILSAYLNSKIEVNEIRALSGGCINQAFKIATTKGVYFLKLNKEQGPEMFEAEAMGLQLLKTSSSISIPEVVGWGSSEGFSYLILEYFESKSFSKDYWKDFGSSLALLHKQTNHFFGLDHSNFIGSLPQFNSPDKNWVSFFIEKRLRVQVNLAADSGRIEKALANRFEQLYLHLDEMLIIEPPSLLHGDLWSGNVIRDRKGKAALIDPAVYYGNREMDLAFSRLFGGFDRDFYESYNKVFPLAPGFEERIDIYNLYPLMVHVNLFGGGYIDSVSSIVNRYH